MNVTHVNGVAALASECGAKDEISFSGQFSFVGHPTIFSAIVVSIVSRDGTTQNQSSVPVSAIQWDKNGTASFSGKINVGAGRGQMTVRCSMHAITLAETPLLIK